MFVVEIYKLIFSQAGFCDLWFKAYHNTYLINLSRVYELIKSGVAT